MIYPILGLPLFSGTQFVWFWWIRKTFIDVDGAYHEGLPLKEGELVAHWNMGANSDWITHSVPSKDELPRPGASWINKVQSVARDPAQAQRYYREGENRIGS